MTDAVFYHLTSRAIVRLTGAEAADLLEDIVTASMADLPEGVARAGALLTPQGRITFDLVFSRDGDDLILEVDADRRDALITRLKLYRMRRDVDITADDTPVHGVIGTADRMLTDPRFPVPAGRVYGSVNTSHEEEAFTRFRWQHGVYETALELIPEKALPLEARLDLDNGISFDKGCYIGQEVTARTRYRGLVKKTYMTVSLPDVVKTPSPLTAGGKDAGDLMACLPTKGGAIGMAVIRLAVLDDDEAVITTEDGISVTLNMPARLLPLPGKTEDRH